MATSSSLEGSVVGPAKDIAREVLIHGPISRGELGRRLGLSPASLTRLSKPLLDRGLFVDTLEPAERSLGRPTKPLDVVVDSQQFVGIKLTADEIVCVRTDLRATPLAIVTVNLPSHDTTDVVNTIVSAVRQLGADDLTAVGVCIGGKVSASSVVERAPFLQWRGVDLGALLATEIGVPVVVENDVVALTAAEHWFGVARGVQNFAVITIGAGVGYGLVIHDRPVVTADAGLGLGGHFPLDPTGPLCADGHRGCSTAMLSIPSMCRRARIGLDREVDYDELLALADAGNPVAVEVVGSAATALGRLIAAAANLAMVNTIVLSGEGVGLVGSQRERVELSMHADRDPEAAPVDILIDDSGFVSWARGAAAVAIQATFV